MRLICFFLAKTENISPGDFKMRAGDTDHESCFGSLARALLLRPTRILLVRLLHPVTLTAHRQQRCVCSNAPLERMDKWLIGATPTDDSPSITKPALQASLSAAGQYRIVQRLDGRFNIVGSTGTVNSRRTRGEALLKLKF